MRRSLSLLTLLLATACGGQPEQKQVSEDLRTFDVTEEYASRPPPTVAPAAPPPPPIVRTASSPDIGPSAAPGVAFNYRYAFRLPAERIAPVQEQHAQACEKLGLDRCRITGMRYRLTGEEDVEAMLAFKLDPTIARQFGKAGIEAVARAEGMLVDSEISGEDAGADIEAANRTLAQLTEDLARIEQELARGGLGASERAELRNQAERLRETIRATRANRSDRQESLAKTPLVFHYGSGDLAPGFDTRSPIGAALEQAGDNFLAAIASMMVVFATLLPWALLLLLIALLYRRFGSPIVRRVSRVEPPQPE